MDPFSVLVFIAALGAGLIAGLFFGFSVLVMRALARVAPSEGLTAMQAINDAVNHPLFWLVFLGTPAVCLVVLAMTLLGESHPGGAFALAGSLIYLLGVFVLTAAYHVPRNNALGAVRPTDRDREARWAAYHPGWTRWNHVRGLAAFVAAALFTLALCA